MNKKVITGLVSSMMLLFAGSAFADVIHVWNCKLNDGKTSADAVTISADWLHTAKTIEGGEDFEVYVNFPIAANAGDGEFLFVLVVPDTRAWGVWFAGDGPNSAIDDANARWAEVAGCSRSAIWDSVKVE